MAHTPSNNPNHNTGNNNADSAGKQESKHDSSGAQSNAPNGAQNGAQGGEGSANGTGTANSRATSLQNYHMLAFRKALHPEFFGIESRNRVEHADYETEAWIFRGGHSLRFQLNGFCLSEVVVEHIDQIPDRGLIAALPCAGERDFEEKVADNLIYMTTMQTETLSDHLYLGTYKEMMQHARENDSLFSAWTDAAGKPNLSLIDVQHFQKELHVQGYHLRSDCGLVLRTQSMVQIVVPKPASATGATGSSSKGVKTAAEKAVRGEKAVGRGETNASSRPANGGGRSR